MPGDRAPRARRRCSPSSESDYYLAAISVGAPPWRIMLMELLPNTMPVLLARASIVAAEAIFVEASLSFVGLGVQPPTASWGTLLQQGYSNLYRSYSYPLFPGSRDPGRGAGAERPRRQPAAGPGPVPP